MSFYRHNKHTPLARMIAVLVCAMLAQTLAAALLHTALVDHIWCETHGDFEHAERAENASADGAEHAANGESANGESAHDSGEHLPGDERRAPDHLCFYLNSLHGPAIPLPSLQAALLNIPPPLEPAAALPLRAQANLPPQIDPLRQSPGLSPPQRMA
jgi:hypothetical protein